MCRVLGYIGKAISIDSLLTIPDNSLFNQSYDPEEHFVLQMAGFGMASWQRDEPNETYPWVYKSLAPPFYDRNLGSLCERNETNVLLAHLRATEYRTLSYGSAVSELNCHPFVYPTQGMLKELDREKALTANAIGFAHNGGIAGFNKIRVPMIMKCKPEIAQCIEGNTDSEVMYALFLSYLEDPTANITAEEMIIAARKMVLDIRELQIYYGIKEFSKLKCFFADSDTLFVANLGIGPHHNLDVEDRYDEYVKAPDDSYEKALSYLLQPIWTLEGKDFESQADFSVEKPVDDSEVDCIIVSSEALTEQHDNWEQIRYNEYCYLEYNDGNPYMKKGQFDF
jgi:glutamine amidotransferase